MMVASESCPLNDGAPLRFALRVVAEAEVCAAEPDLQAARATDVPVRALLIGALPAFAPSLALGSSPTPMAQAGLQG